MGTHAHYYIWAGILAQDVHILPESLDKFLEIANSRGIEFEGLQFTGVGMHGETYGYGVLLKDLDWITTEDRAESPDLELLSTQARELLEKVREAFKLLRLPEEIPCNLYHHLDLGG